MKEIIQTENANRKRVNKKPTIQELRDSIKRYSTHVIGISEEERTELKKYLKK